MRTFLILSLILLANVSIAEEAKDVSGMVMDVEDEVIVGESGVVFEEKPVLAPAPKATPVPVTAPASAPAPAEPVAVPAPKPATAVSEPDPNADVYQYSYSPRDDKSVNYIKDEREIEAGEPGDFIFTLNGEYANYYTGNKNKGGASVELGPQFVFSKYFTTALTATAGVREGNEHKNNLYLVGFKLAPRVRVLPWLFPFVEAGIEFTKVAKGDWEYPFWLFGGGLLFNLGAMDKRSEYNLYRASSIKRTVFIVAFDRIKSPDVKVSTPDVYILRLGFSLEF